MTCKQIFLYTFANCLQPVLKSRKCVTCSDPLSMYHTTLNVSNDEKRKLGECLKDDVEKGKLSERDIMNKITNFSSNFHHTGRPAFG